MVVGLERCPEYRLGFGWYPMYGMGMWMTWKGTSCTDWDGGWFGKVPVEYHSCCLVRLHACEYFSCYHIYCGFKDIKITSSPVAVSPKS
jgi:hypothetical protein